MTQQRVSPISVTSVLPAVPVLSLQAALGQSANLTEWKNSSGTTLLRVANAGQLFSGSSYFANVAGFPSLNAVATSTTATPIVAQGVASQTADLQQWQNSAGAVLCRIDSAGRSIFDSLGVQGSPSGIAYAYFGNAATTTKNVVVRAIASQTANLQEWQDSSGTVLASLGASGAFNTLGSGTMATFTSSTDNARIVYVRGLSFGLRLGSSATAGAVVEGVDAAGGSTSYQPIYIGGSTVALHTGNTTRLSINANGNVLVNGFTASTIGLIIKGAASQTANLQEWQMSDGTIRTRIDSAGCINAGANAANYGASVNILAPNTFDKGLVVRGLASQTADLQQWQDSAGTVLAKVQSNGLVYSGTAVGAPYISDGGSTRPYIDFTVANRLIVNARAASYVALTVDGVASQTGNLTEWRNNSGTILAGVQANGQVFGTLKTNNAYVFIQEQNSGGSTVYTRQTATPAAPGANAANLYFRDGTNAGTLKLVVRAGTGGAETTILDNIPTT